MLEVCSVLSTHLHSTYANASIDFKMDMTKIIKKDVDKLNMVKINTEDELRLNKILFY